MSTGFLNPYNNTGLLFPASNVKKGKINPPGRGVGVGGPKGGGGGASNDPFAANVVLYTRASAGGLVDLKSHAMTLNAPAAVSTTQSKWDSHSVSIGATGSITTPDSADWAFGAGSFTIEGWWYPTDSSVRSQLFTISDATGTDAGSTIFIQQQTPVFSNRIEIVSCYNGGSSIVMTLSGFDGPVFNAWNYMYFCVEGNQFSRGAVNGGTIAEQSSVGLTYNDVAQPLYLGNAQFGLPLVNGFIGPWRVTKGVCRYPGVGTASAPPIIPWPNP
jgi:hypothetical protein